MAEIREFKPVKEFGAIPISDSSELKFYVDEYRGYKYGSVRTFVKGDTYSGPTKSGVTMNAPILQGVISLLSKLPPEPTGSEAEIELGRFSKKVGVELVARITVFRESTSIDLREWVEDVDYKGWSKKGVRIPYKEVSKAIGFLQEMHTLIAKP